MIGELWARFRDAVIKGRIHGATIIDVDGWDALYINDRCILENAKAGPNMSQPHVDILCAHLRRVIRGVGLSVTEFDTVLEVKMFGSTLECHQETDLLRHLVAIMHVEPGFTFYATAPTEPKPE